MLSRLNSFSYRKDLEEDQKFHLFFLDAYWFSIGFTEESTIFSIEDNLECAHPDSRPIRVVEQLIIESAIRFRGVRLSDITSEGVKKIINTFPVVEEYLPKEHGVKGELINT